MPKMVQNNPVYLSKTLFLKGLQCPKALYLIKFHPELRDEVSESQGAAFQSGTQLGILAQGLFPGGREIPYEGLSKEEQLKLTRKEIAGGRGTLYEAAFFYNDIFVKADIIQKGKKGWDLYEVKGSSSVKDVYLDDVAIQYYVLRQSGLPIHNAYIVTVDTQYERDGDLDFDRLFTKTRVTSQVIGKQPSMPRKITRLKKMLRGSIPEIDIGEHCGDPYPCAFETYCRQHLPDYSVLDLSGRVSARWDLYRQGFQSVEEIPLELLNEKHQMEVEAFIARKVVVDKKGIQKFLKSLWYPLYFLDFETINPAVPLYDGTRPFQRIPFQYSLHHLKSPKARLGHDEYLAPPNSDPRKPLLEKLLNRIPPETCILAYNASFEIGVLKQLGEWFPRYRGRLKKLAANVRNLAEPFRKRHLYHWSMKGSFSQKKVLPALVPDLSYEDMEIGDGGMAMLAYFRMCESNDPAEVASLRKNLIDYCRLDTLGMVRLYKELVRKKGH
ncbi:MAG: DUF2779 domain-containing protein [Deltaproteobacteria bacterium]|nr:DUF2779 domain-containing protein [Deltaproteobacteria bacterium]